MVHCNIRRLALGFALGVLLLFSARGDDWPQWRGPNRDGVWSETGILEEFPEPQIKPSWRMPISSGYSGPTVAKGRVYVTDRIRADQTERVLCFNSETGEEIWTHAYDCPYARVGYPAGPRASVLVDDGRAYALGSTGFLHCHDAARGKVLWKKTPGKDYRVRMPIWGVSASPLVEGKLLIVQLGAEDGACVVALDKKTGAEVWRALDDQASYSAPIVIEQAGRRVLVVWSGDFVSGLDPGDGKLLWQAPFKRNKMIISVPTPVLEGERLFVSSFYDGSMMLKLRQDEPAVEQLWRRQGKSETNTDALHAMISTPYLEGDFVYGVDSYGELRCLDARTGDRIWEDLTATPKARWSNIHLVRNGKRMWMFNERGELIIATLSPQGFHEISRAKLIDPTTEQLSKRGGVCWSHPAYANRHVYARNDRELICAPLNASEK